MINQIFNSSDPNPLDIVQTSADRYLASNNELVITSATSVELPYPQANAVVGVRDFGQQPKLTTPSGTIQGYTDRVIQAQDTVYLVSDGTDWYTVSDQSYLGADIPDSVGDQNEWLFSEGSGTTVADTVGSLDANFASLTWDTSFGYDGAYADLDGGDEADLGAGSQSALSNIVAGNGSIGFWMRPDTLDGSPREIFTTSTAVSGSNYFRFGISQNNTLMFRASTNNTSNNFEDIGVVEYTPTANEWVSAVVTLDGSNVRLYINASEQASDAIGNIDSNDLANSVKIGSNGGERYFDGGLDYLWVSPSAVPVSDIQSWHDTTADIYP